jgi:hypothetical protein
MKKNVGTIDKVIRIAIAIIVVALFATEIITGTLAYVLLAVSAVLVATVFLGICPIYLGCGINTKPKKE